MKKCKTCFQTKPNKMFYKRSDSKDGYRNNCIDCQKNNTRKNVTKYQQHNLSNSVDIKTKYCPRCKDIKKVSEFSLCKSRKDGLYDYCKKCDRAGIKVRSNKPKAKYHIYKYQAKNRKLVFDLTLEVFKKLIYSNCNYCGSKSDKTYPHGIDRVDNNIGYVIENCVPCCTLCNNMKKTTALDMFLLQVKKIYAHSIRS